jgi:hypothetical protein
MKQSWQVQKTTSTSRLVQLPDDLRLMAEQVLLAARLPPRPARSFIRGVPSIRRVIHAQIGFSVIAIRVTGPLAIHSGLRVDDLRQRQPACTAPTRRPLMRGERDPRSLRIGFGGCA